MSVKQDVMCYSSVAGDLPKMVKEGKAMCFVEYEEYVKLKDENERLYARVGDLEYDKIGC